MSSTGLRPWACGPKGYSTMEALTKLIELAVILEESTLVIPLKTAVKFSG